ncbi:hypothetical protein V5O48_014265 [Marasmius crinis-equi]|uniref:Uncharacterized protein n=1 Tax=Marasmius crinis-equi TaxID=585013 RepID=A0ABR3EXS7_9AGAR
MPSSDLRLCHLHPDCTGGDHCANNAGIALANSGDPMQNIPVDRVSVRFNTLDKIATFAIGLRFAPDAILAIMCEDYEEHGVEFIRGDDPDDLILKRTDFPEIDCGCDEKLYVWDSRAAACILSAVDAFINAIRQRDNTVIAWLNTGWSVEPPEDHEGISDAPSTPGTSGADDSQDHPQAPSATGCHPELSFGNMPGEHPDAFALRALSSLRFANLASFEELQICTKGRPHKLCVSVTTTGTRSLGEQYFTCPDRHCTADQLSPPRSLEPDERELVVHLWHLFVQYFKAHNQHSAVIESSNSGRADCFLFWMSYALYLHRKDKFTEALEDAKDQLRRYYYRQNKAEITKAEKRRLKSVFKLPPFPDANIHSPPPAGPIVAVPVTNANKSPRKRLSIAEGEHKEAPPAKRQSLEASSPGHQECGARVGTPNRRTTIPRMPTSARSTPTTVKKVSSPRVTAMTPLTGDTSGFTGKGKAREVINIDE